MTEVVSSGGSSVYGYGDYMYVSSANNIRRYIASSWTLDTTWSASIGNEFVLQMAISGNYMYLVMGFTYSTGYPGPIYRITLSNPSEVIEWVNCGETAALSGLAISGNYVYVATNDMVIVNGRGYKRFIKIDIVTKDKTMIDIIDYNVSTGGIAIDEAGRYLYAGVFTGIARLDLDDNTFNLEWYYDEATPKTQSLAVYGDYVYATLAFDGYNTYNTPYNTKQIPITSPTKSVWFDQYRDVLWLCVYNKFLYELTTDSIVELQIAQPTDTLVYSHAKLTATSTETALGMRGTAPLFRNGRRKPVGVIELVARTTPARHKKRQVYTSHLECTITFFDHMSVVAAHFVYATVGSNKITEAITSIADVASGVYSTAKVTMTPKGAMMEVKVEHPRGR
jgi:hypothetical protein